MGKQPKLNNELYESELNRLQAELVEMQEWVKASGARLVVIFEGRDAAGKGGAIKRITEYLNPRVAQVVALPAPTERETTQWYFQRYIPHLPAGGEIRLFDRSWYNRGGVEKVMGYCTPAQHARWLRQVPVFERMLIDDGIMLRKYWFSVSDKEQEKRFRSRMTDPMRRWKLSPTDLESITRWEAYSRAKDEMFIHSDVEPARWYVVEAEDKKRARINMISHLLDSIPYQHVQRPPIEFPKRPKSTGYERTDRSLMLMVPDYSEHLAPHAAPQRYVDPEDDHLPSLPEDAEQRLKQVKKSKKKSRTGHEAPSEDTADTGELSQMAADAVETADAEHGEAFIAEAEVETEAAEAQTADD